MTVLTLNFLIVVRNYWQNILSDAKRVKFDKDATWPFTARQALYFRSITAYYNFLVAHNRLNLHKKEFSKNLTLCAVERKENTG